MQAARDYLIGLQSRIVTALQAEDPGRPFRRDAWTREPGAALEGDGASHLVEGGELFERGGCNFSHVRGRSLPPSASAHRPDLAGAPFEALGVSLVLHPRNPYVPTVHMNVRLLAALPPGGEPVAWYGGGMDLTPYYGFEDDARHFHRSCAAAVGPERHARFKAWCDAYFFIKHRNEARGVGGIFFDDQAEADGQGLMQSVGDAFLPAYLPIVQRRRETPYGERERDFQAYRRGRYVEFNLVWDRGTLFGLQSGGRTESILMSMPPLVAWRYDWRPEPGTPEAALYSDFLPPRDWGLTVRRIGLYGGTFDPVHVAHVALAQAALDALQLDEMRWLPAGQPWQKAGRVVAPAADRIAMLRLVVQALPRHLVDTLEIERDGPSYTLQTVQVLQAAEPGADWWLVVGQDQLVNFTSWHGWQDLLGCVTLAVAQRPGVPASAAGIEHVTVPLPPMAVSSSAIRCRVAAGADISQLVTPEVARYIDRHALYRARS